MKLENLPDEILLVILSYQSLDELHQNVALVSKRFLKLSRTPNPLTCLHLRIDQRHSANFNADLLALHFGTKKLDIHVECFCDCADVCDWAPHKGTTFYLQLLCPNSQFFPPVLLANLPSFNQLRHLRVAPVGFCNCYHGRYSLLWKALTSQQLKSITSLDLGDFLGFGEEQGKSFDSLRELDIDAERTLFRNKCQQLEYILSRLGPQLNKLHFRSRESLDYYKRKGKTYFSDKHPWHLLANCIHLTHLSLIVSSTACWNAIAAIPNLQCLSLTFEEESRVDTTLLQPMASSNIKELELHSK